MQKIEIITIETFFYSWYVNGDDKKLLETPTEYKYQVNGKIVESLNKKRISDFYVEELGNDGE